MGKRHLAIDIGASSGRHILGVVEGGRIGLEEVFRFDNAQVARGGHDCWDHQALARSVLRGLAKCGELGKAPDTVGVDTWGVDFVLVDGRGVPVGDMVAYRDARTRGMDAEVERVIPWEELYARIGIARQPFNTVYQLMALKREHPEQLERAERLLFVPDYLNFVLTGVMANEYTEATTSGLVDPATFDWDFELIDRLGLPRRIFGPLSMPGVELGGFTAAVASAVGFDARLVLPATHDTGSAYLAVPARGDSSVFISSGTWSLLGVESDRAITTPAAREGGFTNEGGAWRRFRFLQNIMGLWMIQSIRRELNGVNYVEGRERVQRWKGSLALDRESYSFADLESLARAASGFAGRVNVNDARFLDPPSMIDAVLDSADVRPSGVGELMQCVYASLAECYARAVGNLSSITGRAYDTVNIVGGGSKDGYLNELTAKATGLEVYAGPVEGTAIGNLLVQMIASGEFPDLAAARAAVAASFDVRRV